MSMLLVYNNSVKYIHVPGDILYPVLHSSFTQVQSTLEELQIHLLEGFQVDNLKPPLKSQLQVRSSVGEPCEAKT